MKDFFIYIPTRGRIEKQFTWDSLSPELKEIATLVCPEEEAEAHQKKGRKVFVRPINGLSAVRQWILENAKHRYIVMPDDDLKFYHRAKADAWNLQACNDIAINILFHRLHYNLKETYVHGGVSPRQMNNQHYPAKEIENSKNNAVLAIDRKILLQEKVRYDYMPLMSDYSMTLQLFMLGYPNFIITDYAWNQGGATGAKGGCSNYRTPALQGEVAEAMAARYPDVVRVEIKEPKGSWGTGQEQGEWKKRKDVRIQWKKAYEIGIDEYGRRIKLDEETMTREAV
jgi:hypothetical protein